MIFPQVDEFTSHGRATCPLLPTRRRATASIPLAYAQDICLAGKHAGTAEVAGQRIKIGPQSVYPLPQALPYRCRCMHADSLLECCRVRDGSRDPFPKRVGRPLCGTLRAETPPGLQWGQAQAYFQRDLRAWCALTVNGMYVVAVLVPFREARPPPLDPLSMQSPVHPIPPGGTIAPLAADSL